MRTLLTSTAVALCLAATSTHAEMKRISTSGYWSADAGTNNGGYPMCMVETWGTGFDGSSMSMMIKYDTAHPDWFAYQLFKQSWNLPPGQRIRIAVKIDNAPGRIFTGVTANGRHDMIDFEIQLGATDPQTGEPETVYLGNLLRAGQMLRISFPDGNEADWGAPLNGANAALTSMSNCIGYLANAASSPSYQNGGQAATTQPYRQQQATQPYGNRQQLPATQKTTQPYTPL